MPAIRLCVEELLRSVSRPPIYIAAVLLAALTAGGMVRAHGDLEAQRAQYREELQERAQARLRTGNPSGRVIDPGLRVLRSPNPTTILVKGNVAVVPAAWDFGPAGAVARPPYLPFGTGTAAAAFMDFESVVLIFGGLLCLALGLERVIDDRYSGWNSVLRAVPIPWRFSVSARLAAGAGTVSVVLALWLAIVVAMVAVIEPEAAAVLQHTATALGLPSWLYLQMFYLLGVAAAHWSKTAARAVALGMVSWLLASFILPQGLALIDRAIDPGITRQSLERERQEAFADEFRRFEDEIGRRIAAQVPSGPALRELSRIDEPILTSLNLDMSWLAGAAAARKIAQEYESKWQSIQLGRQQLQDRHMALSPASAFTRAVAELAGNGWTSHRDWERSAIEYHSLLSAALFDDRPVMNTRVPVGVSTPSFALDRREWKPYGALPSFNEPSSENRNRWRSALPAISWLLVHFVAVLVLAYRGGMREMATLKRS